MQINLTTVATWQFLICIKGQKKSTQKVICNLIFTPPKIIKMAEFCTNCAVKYGNSPDICNN